MTAFSTPTEQALRRTLLDRQTTGRVPGLVGAVARKGEVVWTDAVGAADLEDREAPLDADTQFLIASITKTFTAVLVMALRDEGKLTLDDPIERHIPESSHEGITVRQMLSHVTGMQREPVGDVWDMLEFPDRAELVKGWNDAERVLKPHHRHHYSNLCYALLGEIVARLDGREWHRSLQARVLDPLEMTRTSVGLVAPNATGYYVPPFSDVPVKEPLLDISAMASAGALASTAAGLATWSGFWADPVEEVLSKDTVEEMCQPQIMSDLDEWKLAWGLGVMIAHVEGRHYVGHTGGMPGHITGMFVHRDSATGGIVLMNTTSAPSPALVAIELAGTAIEREPVEPEPWTPGTESPAELQPLLGTWFSEGQPFTFSVVQGKLHARLDTAPDTLAPSIFVKVEDDLYRTESGRETGELLRITRDDHGTVTKLHWATYLFTRQPLAFGEWL